MKKINRKFAFSALLLFLQLFSVQLNAQEPDAIRGGWIADVDGIRHVYLLVVRGKAVTGIYCTDCSNPANLAFVDDGMLDQSGLHFNVYYDFSDSTTEGAIDAVQAELIDGELHLNRAGVAMVLHRSPVEPEIASAPPGGFNPAPIYVPPGSFEAVSMDNVLGLWLAGNGPNKQYFMFKQHRGQVLGMACGQCEDTSDMAVIDGVILDGTNLHFDIVHEDSGPGIVEYGPHKNITDATIARNEMHISVVPSFEAADFTPIEMTLLGPIKFQDKK